MISPSGPRSQPIARATTLCILSSTPPIELRANAMAARSAIDSMDWLSINTGCFGVSNAIAKTSSSISQFRRQVPESRSEFDIISSELHSLDGVVELVKDEASSFPPPLANKTPAVLETCHALVNELEGCISVLDRSSASRVDKESRWLASRDHIGKLRWTLEGYKYTLWLAVDLVALGRRQKVDTNGDGLFAEKDGDRKTETANVVGEIRALTERFEEEARQNGAVAHLQQYLHALHIHAITAAHEEVNQLPDRRRAPSSVTCSDAPDSAIELSDDQTSPFGTAGAYKQPRIQGSPAISTSLDEVDELLDELGEMPGEAPVPPPRSSARRAPSVNSNPSHDRWPSTSGSCSVSISSGNRSVTNHSPQNSLPQMSHMRSWSLSPSETQESIFEGYSTPGTDISGPSDRQPDSVEIKRPDSETIGQLFDFAQLSGWENPRAQVPVPDVTRPSTSSSSMTSQSALPRRSSSRLSTALKGLRIGRRSSSKARGEGEAQPQRESEAQSQPAYLETRRAVFGISLTESMQVAKGIGQDGYGSTESRKAKASSTRGYPLSVLRCVYFIQERGIQAPHIFGQDGDHNLLANLKEIFSSVDTGYGKILDWDQFTVHEAANLILQFLSELPTPLVPPTAAKRWVSLSRQATISGSMALRLDQGIDFWEEALLGIHGPSRALLRLLLNLWGVIADMAEFNDMTAERLAGRVMRPLMHLPPARFDTDLMLGLAFMIRKRSEYQMKAKGGGRRSNAAF